MITDTAGDLVFQNYQYEFNGFLFGADTSFKVERMEGLRALPAIDNKMTNRPGRHGNIPGSSYYMPRSVSWDMWLLGAAHTLDGLMDTIGGAFVITDGEVPFVFQRPALGKRRLYTRVSRADTETGYHFALGKGEASFELLASDPFFYSNTQWEESTNIDSGSASASFTVDNKGKTASERIIIAVRGPIAAESTIQCVEDSNRQIKLLDALDTDEWLEIDMFHRTAIFYADTAAFEANDGTHVYNFQRGDSQWWKLPPGTNTININRGTSTGTARLEVHWRDAWIV